MPQLAVPEVVVITPRVGIAYVSEVVLVVVATVQVPLNAASVPVKPETTMGLPNEKLSPMPVSVTVPPELLPPTANDLQFPAVPPTGAVTFPAASPVK